jgi:hypothetical protein
LTPFVYSVGPLVIMTLFTIGTIRNLRFFHSLNHEIKLTKGVRRMLISQLVVLGVFGISFVFQGFLLT